MDGAKFFELDCILRTIQNNFDFFGIVGKFNFEAEAKIIRL